VCVYIYNYIYLCMYITGHRWKYMRVYIHAEAHYLQEFTGAIAIVSFVFLASVMAHRRQSCESFAETTF